MNLPKHIRKYLQDIRESMDIFDSMESIHSMNNSHEMDREEGELAKISAFIRCGLFVLSIILISGIAIAYGQNKLQEQSVPASSTIQSESEATTTYTKSEKKLPIYCVDTNEKKVALSFDAAWGAGRTVQNLTNSYSLSGNYPSNCNLMFPFYLIKQLLNNQLLIFPA
jgi:hypothetical protein